MTRPFTDTETITWMSTLEKRMSSAAIALYDATGRVLVVKAHYKHYWSFPGGVVDAGETPRQAAVRETKEEVGVAVEADALAFLHGDRSCKYSCADVSIYLRAAD